MKEFDIGKWIKRACILFTMFLTYDSIMNTLDVIYKETLKNANIVDNTIDTSNFLTMNDLGFEYHETTKSKVDKVDLRIDPSGYIYELEMNNNDANNYVSIDLTFYKFSDEKIARESFEALVRVLYKNSIKGIGCYIGTCHIPEIDFESTISHMYEINNEVWNVDSGYSLNEVFSNEWNHIVLLKDNQVLIFEYNSNSALNESHIPTISNLLEKTNLIFDNYEGE